MIRRLVVSAILLLLTGSVTVTVSSARTIGLLLLAAGGLTLLPALILTLRQRRSADLRQRAPVYSLNTLLLSFFVAGILILLNVLVHRSPLRFDLTVNRRHTLADQTVKILQSFPGPVHITCFLADTDAARQSTTDLIDLYRYWKPDLEMERADLNRRPDLASRLKVSQYRTTVLEAAGRQERFSGVPCEEKLSRALLLLSRQRPRTIAFLRGHGERNLDDETEAGLSRLRQLLEEGGYALQTLSPADPIPPETELLVVAGPRLALLDTTRRRIEEALERGMSLLLCLDPAPGRAWQELASPLGVDVTDTLIYDRQGGDLADNPLIPVVVPSGKHPVTGELNAACAFPLARCVRVGKRPSDDWRVQVLLRTGRDSFARPDTADRERDFDPQQDMPGPLSLAVVLERSQSAGGETRQSGPGKIAVFGDSDFLANHTLYFQGTHILVRNLVLWLTEDESLIALDDRPWLAQTVRLGQSQRWALFWVTLVFLPGIFLLSGMFVYLRGRS